jgi:chromosome segregation ATPase
MPNHECTPECIAELEGLAEEAESRANELACTLHRERDELSALRARVSELEAEIGKLREERDACQSEMAKARRLKQDAESRRDVEIVVNHELRDALREAEALIARNVYPTPDKPNSDWAVLQRVRAALGEKSEKRERGCTATAMLGTPHREGWVSYCVRCNESIVYRDGAWMHCCDLPSALSPDSR